MPEVAGMHLICSSHAMNVIRSMSVMLYANDFLDRLAVPVMTVVAVVVMLLDN